MSPIASSRTGRVCDGPRRGTRKRRGVAALIAWGLLAIVPAATADNPLPDLGDAAGETLTRAEEERLGDEFLRQVRRGTRLVDDPDVVDYIGSLGQRIASADEGQRYRFLVVDSPSVNAFAGPGGVIAVNAGLIVITESESELAAVVAHEIAHVSLRHIAQLIERSRLTSLTTLAGLFAGILIATQNPQAGQATLAASAAGAQHTALSYSREKEMEADRIGMELLYRAGFDPRAVPAFFERFQEWQRFMSRPPEFLSTHPITLSRIADTRGRAEQFEPRPYHESIEYPLIRAKLRTRLAAKPADAVEHFEARVADGGSDAAEADRYGLAIALMSSNRHEEAKALLAGLRKDFPDRAAHRTAAAEAYTALGEDGLALELLADSVERFPDHRALVYAYGLGLVRAGRADDATALFRSFQRNHDSDVTLYRLIALAHQRAGRRAASHMALAEFHARNGDLEPAIRQLDIALGEPTIDDYESARAEARRQQLVNRRAQGR